MTRPSLLSVFLLGLALLAIISLIRRVIAYRRLSHIKGPTLAAWTSFWVTKQAVQARSNVSRFQALKKYGSPCRIGPNLVLVDDPELIKHMSAPRSGWMKTNWYGGMKLEPRIDNVFSSQDETFHAQVKAMEIGAYNGRDVDTHEDDIDENIVKLLNLIKREYSGGKIIDLVNISSWFTLDVLSRIAFGESFGFMEANRDLWDYNKINGQFFGPLEILMTPQKLRAVMQNPWFQKMTAPKPTDKNGQGAVYGWALERIQARYTAVAEKSSSSRKDMLNYFISKGLPMVQIEAESRLQVIAGADSTSSVIRNTMMLLITHPAAYFKLQKEIDDAVEAGNIAFPVGNYSQTQKLEYLQAVIWEGVRVYPPLFGLKSKQPPPGGETFNGVFYPEGTEVGMCDEAVCKRTEIFGDDVDLFRPERFLTTDPAVNARRLRTTELMFGSGRYGCLGKWIAMMELNKTFVALFRNFDWSIPDPFSGSKMVAQGIWIQEGLNVVATSRNI